MNTIKVEGRDGVKTLTLVTEVQPFDTLELHLGLHHRTVAP
jgi:hypothetical protein